MELVGRVQERVGRREARDAYQVVVEAREALSVLIGPHYVGESRRLEALRCHYDEDMPQFARDEAESLIPKVKPYLEDIQRRKEAFDRRPTEPLAAELRALIAAVAGMGVEVKDLDVGLIDFPTVRRGRPIYLCWKLGEGERITWWHEPNTGFAGRRPIAELYEN